MKAKRLWDKGARIDQQIHAFTVGNDYINDLEILPFDLVASAAHAKVLVKNKVLRPSELDKILNALKQIDSQSKSGKFKITPEQEDCHTAIESYLTEKLGELGKKIHTGRSRNDQVLTATRLYLKDKLFELFEMLIVLNSSLISRYNRDQKIVMPGYTHFQKAMPSSAGMWLGSYIEWINSLLKTGLSLLSAIDESPLGVGSGFGIPLNMSRHLSAKQMGFSDIQRNPIHVQNSRGRSELKAIGFFLEVGSLIEKFACDLMLYTSSEFDFVALPESFTTGSSIMPQKRNPDVIELLRATNSQIKAAFDQIFYLISKLPSSYHRDFQHSKEPLINSSRAINQAVIIMNEVVKKMSFKVDKLKTAMTDDLYVTYDVYRQVRAGISFREAYRDTATKFKAGEIDFSKIKNDFKIIEKEIQKETKEGIKVFSKLKRELDAKGLTFRNICKRAFS